MKEVWNAILHVLGGALIALSIMWVYWLAIPALAVVGFLREQAQHRDEGFFGWITKHRMIEAMEWPLGALIGCLVWTVIK